MEKRHDENKEFIWLDRSKLATIINKYPELRGPPGPTGKKISKHGINIKKK